jgi:hypothetical protein
MIDVEIINLINIYHREPTIPSNGRHVGENEDKNYNLLKAQYVVTYKLDNYIICSMIRFLW